MEQKVIELLKRVFEGVEITTESSQETITEWDSLHQLSIAFEIESEFGISLEPEEITQMKSVETIMNLIKNKE